MSSFLQKLKGKGVSLDEHEGDHAAAGSAPAKTEAPAGVMQLPVDVKQSDTEIIIFAQVPGVEVQNIDVSIEGDNDVITIQGQSHRPESMLGGAAAHGTSDAAGVAIHTGPVQADDHSGFALEECVWGKFFKQIILPNEVDAANAQAKVKDGVLLLRLPLKGHSTNKIRMQVEKMDAA